MTDLKFEQKRSLSRLEAADQLTALAAALRQGGDAELELEPWKLSLRVPSDLHSEIEVEVGDGEIELEIELKWSTASDARPTEPEASAGTEKSGGRRKSAAAGSGGTRAGGGRTAKRTAAKKS
ncbi:amphi-Trp domain-containing protein [Streptomyces sp. AC550_RSS872]|uniref:amphi-Trp domain-containing protein n=1 Tax=Streptomyces sp. AC550_RSS872 TaxID=2823689 RepID=UPI001C268080|nr:amphi-Trp domain-containing protein [Streptomyces sp. AC550_RSS872]